MTKSPLPGAARAMKIIFCRSDDLGGLLIRLFTLSRWNHVAIEIDGIVYEAHLASQYPEVT